MTNLADDKIYELTGLEPVRQHLGFNIRRIQGLLIQPIYAKILNIDSFYVGTRWSIEENK